MNKILVFGSLNIDYVYNVDHIVKEGETLSSSSIEKNSGGKGLNQACALGRTGLEVYMAGKVGLDGNDLIKTLNSFNVDTSYVVINSEVLSGNAIIQRAKDGQNSIILSPGANMTIDDDMVKNVISDFNKGDYLVLQNEINNLDLIIKTAKEKGMKIVFNPAPFDESVFNLPLDSIDILVVNEIEGAQLCKSVTDSFSDILALLNLNYPNCEVILTCGSEGCFYAYKNSSESIKALEVDAIDTTAAGDTFIGYYLASKLLGYQSRDALVYATKAASIAVCRYGAASSVPSKDEVYGVFNE